jgi:23S rRNA pseudouridine1911/1915/1917 synthase
MEDRTLLTWLTQQYPLAKRTTFRRMLTDRRVRVNGAAIVKLNHVLSANDRIEVGDRVEPKSRKPAYIVHEDADIIVVNKPTGLLTSTGPQEKRKTLLQMLRDYLVSADPRARLGLIHRLDRDASGLLVFSKSDVAYRSLKAQFFDHTVLREYAAIIHGVLNPRAGKIDSRLIERADGTVHSTSVHAKGQRAITDYETTRTENGLSLLRLRLFTGRKHQIRVHLSERGTVIVGDAMYGAKDDGTRLMLAAIRLGFEHPRTGKPVMFELPLPAEFTLQG